MTLHDGMSFEELRPHLTKLLSINPRCMLEAREIVWMAQVISAVMDQSNLSEEGKTAMMLLLKRFAEHIASGLKAMEMQKIVDEDTLKQAGHVVFEVPNPNSVTDDVTFPGEEGEPPADPRMN